MFCPWCGKPVPDLPDAPQTRLAPEMCNYCGGDGKDFASPCSVCGGQGSVLVVQPAQKCATCGGDGKDFALRCTACGGSGWAHTRK